MWAKNFGNYSLKGLLRRGITMNNLHQIKESVENGASVNESLIIRFRYKRPLNAAIEMGCDLEIIQYLLEHGANVKHETMARCPLALAITQGELDMVELLVGAGADVNFVDVYTQNTPLIWSIRCDQLQIASYLIKEGAEVNAIGCDGKTALSWAITTKDFEAVKLLVSKGADINKTNTNGTTPLQLADLLDDKTILDYLRICLRPSNSNTTPKVKNTARPVPSVASTSRNTATEASIRTTKDMATESPVKELQGLMKDVGRNVGNDGSTPLVRAVETGNLDTVKDLIAKGANVCKVGSDGKTPLLVAVSTRNLDMIKCLLDNGARFTLQSAFLEAITLQDLKIAKYLVEQGVVLNVTYTCGHTPLTKSIETGNLEMVKLLIDAGAKVDMPNRHGDHPLTIALKTGNLDIAKYIIGQDAKLPPNVSKKFPFLLKSIEDNNFEMVEMIVGLGVELNVVFDCGFSPLTKAVQVENYKMVKFFIQMGANVDQAGADGRTPLAIAAANRDLRTVSLLIEEKADVELAKEEIDSLAKNSDDFAIYLATLNGGDKSGSVDSGHQGAQ